MKLKSKLVSTCAIAASLLCSSVAWGATVTLGEIKTGGIVTLIGPLSGFTLDQATGLDFINQYRDGGDGLLIGAAGSGLFDQINCTAAERDPAGCGSIGDIFDFSSFAGRVAFLTVGGVVFNLDAPLLIQRNPESSLRLAGLTVSGSGFANFENTLLPAKFTLNTQGTETTNTSYAASLVVTRTAIPEPASLLLFGAGVAGALAARRKRS